MSKCISDFFPAAAVNKNHLLKAALLLLFKLVGVMLLLLGGLQLASRGITLWACVYNPVIILHQASKMTTGLANQHDLSLCTCLCYFTSNIKVIRSNNQTANVCVIPSDGSISIYRNYLVHYKRFLANFCFANLYIAWNIPQPTILLVQLLAQDTYPTSFRN